MLTSILKLPKHKRRSAMVARMKNKDNTTKESEIKKKVIQSMFSDHSEEKLQISTEKTWEVHEYLEIKQYVSK